VLLVLSHKWFKKTLNIQRIAPLANSEMQVFHDK